MFSFVHTRAFARSSAVLLAAVTLIGAAPASAVESQPTMSIIVITHPPVVPLLVQGAGIGAVRTFYTPVDVRGSGGGTHYMTGTLTTTAKTADGGREIRVANLVFVLGRSFNQIVVGGVAYYPADGSTLAVGDKAVRPIIGGSGRYARAHGWVVSTNLGDAGWRHEFHVSTQ